MNEEFRVIKGMKIDPLIFTFKFTCRCIGGECCQYGVYADLKEYEKILSVKDEVIGLMDESQSKNVAEWFESPEKDDDFESGIAVGTNIINDKCTFLDKHGLCTLQKLGLTKGVHKWTHKPLFCVLFPLTVYQGALTVDDEHIDRLTSCNRYANESHTIFDSCKEELRYFLGEDGFLDLEQYRKEYLSRLKTKELV
jgi:Fe-S-cluster containining protein